MYNSGEDGKSMELGKKIQKALKQMLIFVWADSFSMFLYIAHVFKIK